MCEVDDELEALNALPIYTQAAGGVRIIVGRGASCGYVAEPQNEGWRECVGGDRERVTFYTGYGWLTPEELFDLQQKRPREAP